MLAEPEHYKGILYIRISSLPENQKNNIRAHYARPSIVKILKENSLINDCIIYSDYLQWYEQYRGVKTTTSIRQAKPVGVLEAEMVKK